MPIQASTELIRHMAPEESTWDEISPVSWPDLNDIASMPGATHFDEDEDDLTSELSLENSGRWIVY